MLGPRPAPQPWSVIRSEAGTCSRATVWSLTLLGPDSSCPHPVQLHAGWRAQPDIP